MTRFLTRRVFTTTRRMMTKHDGPHQSDKLIFAPGSLSSQPGSADGGGGGQAAQFTLGTLSRADLDDASPLTQFRRWFTDAQRAVAGAEEQGRAAAPAETCTLSTAEMPSGRVSSRTVYLKELRRLRRAGPDRGEAGRGEEEKGAAEEGLFVVYTNLETSRKARDVRTNPHAALCFYWPALQRQVRVEGAAVTDLDGGGAMAREESQRYFDTRARGSRLGAWASRQSEVLEPSGEGDDGREGLEGRAREAERRFAGVERVRMPAFWGGLGVVPERMEFWQGRESRLHDRFVYERAEGGWRLSRLSP